MYYVLGVYKVMVTKNAYSKWFQYNLFVFQCVVCWLKVYVPMFFSKYINVDVNFAQIYVVNGLLCIMDMGIYTATEYIN